MAASRPVVLPVRREKAISETQPGPYPLASSSDERQIRALYQQALDGWNQRNAAAYAAAFAEDGDAIGFDGSQHIGRAEIASSLTQIFANHRTAAYVSKVRSVRLLDPDVALVRAVVGMAPPGQADIAPALNAIQTMVAVRQDGAGRIALLQSTPAQFHGRPELAQQLTDELQQVLPRVC